MSPPCSDPAAGEGTARAPDARVDVRDVACPLTWVRTRVALERLAPGQRLEVLLLAGEPLENVPATAEAEGHHVVAREPWPGAPGAWRVVLGKAEAVPGGASPADLVP